MKPYNDNDIEILGGNPTPKKRRIPLWLIIAVAGFVVAIAIIIGVYLFARSGNDVKGPAEESIAEVETTIEIVAPTDTATTLPVEFTDSINNVAFTAISLEGCRAEVSFETPCPTDSDILVATIAADTRADNSGIVGEFIHDRKQLSRGSKKRGFCYISPVRSITIGSGAGEHLKDLAITEGGTFFRQYPLVMGGENQPNTLKGKSERRALAVFKGKPIFVISKNRESIYDFSQALADYGFSHALYLPGGKNFLKLLTNKSDLYYAADGDKAKFTNYLIFKH